MSHLGSSKYNASYVNTIKDVAMEMHTRIYPYMIRTIYVDLFAFD